MKNQQNEPYSEILALAQALTGLHEQSCLMLKPIVDDCCKHPESVDGDAELAHSQSVHLPRDRRGGRAD